MSAVAGLLKPVPKAVWRRGSDRKGGGLLGSATPFGGGETSNLDHSRGRDGFYLGLVHMDLGQAQALIFL